MRDTAAAIADVKDCLRGFATAFAKYVAVAARTQVFLDLAEYASLKRNYKQKLYKASCRIQRFVRYHMFRGKLMRQTRMIVAMRKIFWRPDAENSSQATNPQHSRDKRLSGRDAEHWKGAAGH